MFDVISYIISFLFPFEGVRLSSFLLLLSDLPEFTIKRYDLLFTFCPSVSLPSLILCKEVDPRTVYSMIENSSLSIYIWNFLLPFIQSYNKEMNFCAQYLIARVGDTNWTFFFFSFLVDPLFCDSLIQNESLIN